MRTSKQLIRAKQDDEFTLFITHKVPIKPSSLKVALDGITSNRATLAVELDIECDSDYITYVDFDIFDKDTNQR